MAIDIEKETLISLAVAARTWPGGEIAPESLWRYYARGVGGVRLETVVIGGARRYTSRKAIRHFIAARTAAADARLSGATQPSTLALPVSADVRETAREEGQALRAMLNNRRRGA